MYRNKEFVYQVGKKRLSLYKDARSTERKNSLLGNDITSVLQPAPYGDRSSSAPKRSQCFLNVQEKLRLQNLRAQRRLRNEGSASMARANCNANGC